MCATMPSYAIGYLCCSRLADLELLDDAATGFSLSLFSMVWVGVWRTLSFWYYPRLISRINNQTNPTDCPSVRFRREPFVNIRRGCFYRPPSTGTLRHVLCQIIRLDTIACSVDCSSVNYNACGHGHHCLCPSVWGPLFWYDLGVPSVRHLLIGFFPQAFSWPTRVQRGAYPPFWPTWVQPCPLPF
jgi:hypothetical protein